jgi:hypothetical protein
MANLVEKSFQYFSPWIFSCNEILLTTPFFPPESPHLH